MNRKIIETIITTLSLILFITGVAYGLSYSGYSQISTSILTVTGTSVTTTDELAYLTTNTYLYRDSILVATNYADETYATYQQISAKASNEIGNQKWESVGWHYIYSNGYNYSKTSSTTTWY